MNEQGDGLEGLSSCPLKSGVLQLFLEVVDDVKKGVGARRHVQFKVSANSPFF